MGRLPEEPYFYSAENEMDFGSIPNHLPELSMVEQFIISPVHVFTQVRQVRGAQYRFKGHVVSFARDIGRVFDQLPLLPEELDIVILKPKNDASHNQVLHQHGRDFKVRRAHIVAWLTYLRYNHSAFSNVTVNLDRTALAGLATCKH